MSLDPESYKNAIGIAHSKTGYASCLVFLGHLTGEHPCGCDGWSLEERDGMIFGYGRIFPPEAEFFPREERLLNIESKELFADVQRIRQEYLNSYG